MITQHAPTFLSIVPPLLVLALGILTHRIVTSLVIGLCLAALIAVGGNVIDGLQLLIVKFWSTADIASLSSWETINDSQTILIFLFLINLGIIVAILDHTGCAQAYANMIRKKLKNACQVEQASLLLSLVLFLDDYFSTLTVGSIMRPITDKFKIPPVKLAFLIDSMAAPMAVLMPISSWVAVIMGQIQRAGISETVTDATVIIGDPFLAYLSLLPYMFYSFILMISAWFIVLKRISFGPMRSHEIAAQENHEQSRSVSSETECNARATLTDFVAPIALFMIVTFIALLMSGDSTLFGGSNNFLDALRTAKAAYALALGSIVSLIVSIGYLYSRSLLELKKVPGLLYKGAELMAPAMLILFLCWTFGNMLNQELHTGNYIATLLAHTVPLWSVPALFFVVSSITSFAMGSSWGTIGIIIPIAVPMLIKLAQLEIPIPIGEVPCLFPMLGAILSGAVLGDHVSPISDTTIMSSASTGSYHLDHVYTQLVYVLPIFVGTLTACLVGGIWPETGFIGGIATGTAVSLAILTVCNQGHPETASRNA
ncbi:MAG: Na+ antiporter NhaC [Candidatus Dependentiae bacterium]|nr:Na+ antiporter NhaC [Candidatus Dependentiae bacterium]